MLAPYTHLRTTVTGNDMSNWTDLQFVDSGIQVNREYCPDITIIVVSHF